MPCSVIADKKKTGVCECNWEGSMVIKGLIGH